MTINGDLAAWEEPAATPEEETLAGLLSAMLEKLGRGEDPQQTLLLADSPDAQKLARTVTLLEEFSATVQARSGVPEATRAVSCGEDLLPDPFPGEFRIVKALGEGAFGRVWLAEDLNIGRPVALKALKVSHEARDHALTAVRNEAGLLGSVRHPNVVQIYGVRRSGEDWYLVLQFVAGGSIATRLANEGPLPWERAARYVADIGEALVHVHSCSIIHRDVNPANILWDPESDEAVLTDFGISCRLAESVVGAGTLPYLAPEAFAGAVTPALDVFGLAATMFRLVTGEPPFPAQGEAEHIAKVAGGLPVPDARCAALPSPLEDLIRKGLAAAAKDRPGLKEFAETLRGTLNRLLADSMLLEAGGQGRRSLLRSRLSRTETLPENACLCVFDREPQETGAQARRSAVGLRIEVSRDPGSRHLDLPTVQATPLDSLLDLCLTRDLARVPPSPDRIRLSTGDRIRIRVAADRGGYITVFNIGPTGNLHLLWPVNTAGANTTAWVEPKRPIDVPSIEATPPCGRERLVATWSRQPLPFLQVADWARQGAAVSRPYCATRDLERVRNSVRQMERQDWDSVVLELDHDE